MVIKASGFDEISGYFKTYSENDLRPFVTKLFNKFYDLNVPPQTGTHMLLYHCSKG